MKISRYTYRSLLLMFAIPLFIFVIGCGSDEEKEAEHHKRAKEYIEKEEFKNAVIELRNVVQLNPKNDAAYYELGEAYLNLKQVKEAFQAFSQAASINADNLDAQLKIGQILLLGEKTEDARKQAEVILEKSPGNIDALLLLSGTQIQGKDIDSALATLEKGTSTDPDNFKIHVALGRLFLLKNDIDQAKKAYQKAKSIDSSSSLPYSSLARIYGFEKKWDQTETELKEMISKSGSDYKNLFELARFYESRKEWSKAEDIYLRASSSASENDVTPLIGLSGFYSRRKSFDKALETMQKASSLKKEDLNILVGIAQLYLENMQIEKASETLDKILEKENGHVEASFLKGRVYLVNKDFDNALPLFDLTVSDRPNNAMAHYFKALCLLGKGEEKPAQSSLLKAVELNSQLLDARLILAEFYLQERNIDLARQQIDTAFELDSNNIKVLMLKGNLKILEKNSNEAEALFMQVTKTFPDYAPGYVKLGLLYGLTGEHEKALENLEKAINMDPKQMDALALAINIYSKSGKFDEAIQLCAKQKERISENQPLLAQIEYMEGKISLARKDTKAARLHFEKAIATDSNILAAYVALAKLYIRENKIQEALSQYESLLEKEPKSLTGNMGLGTIYDQQGDIEKAEACYRKALEIKSDFAPAANNLAWNLLQSGGNIDEALGFAQIAKEHMPQNSSVMDTLGWLYYLKGSYLNAIAELQDSLKLEPDNPVINYHMGMAYYKNGQTDSAKQFLEKVLEIDKNFKESEEVRRVLKGIDSSSRDAK